VQRAAARGTEADAEAARKRLWLARTASLEVCLIPTRSSAGKCDVQSAFV